ncbi:hypothetical protein MMC14_004435 [Varicellaria rhodocarpa]|nr:hypothetical protein [Varicellaria rhodocarpa]
MPVPSLYHLAKKACIKNIRHITDVGDVPYDFVRPILLKLENPEQLRELEKVSPQILGVDAELWREFIKRDIESWEEKIREPKNPENWYKVYRKLRVENDKAVDQDAEALKAAMDGIKNERAKHTSRVVDAKTVPRLPRMGGMRVEPGSRTSSRVAGNGNPSILTFASGSKTKTLTGKGVMAKARREARELSLFSARKSTLTTPTHQLSSKATQIRHVPKGMVAEHRRIPLISAAKPDAKPTATIIAPKKRKLSGEIVPPASAMSNEERERRLRAFTTPAATVRQESDSPAPQVKYKSLRVSPAQGKVARVSPEGRAGSPLAVGGTAPPPRPAKQVNPFMPAAKRRRI